MRKLAAISCSFMLLLCNNFTLADTTNKQADQIQIQTEYEKLQWIIESSNNPEKKAHELKVTEPLKKDQISINKDTVKDSTFTPEIDAVPEPIEKADSDNKSPINNNQLTEESQPDLIDQSNPLKNILTTEISEPKKSTQKIDIANQTFSNDKEKGLAIIKEVDQRDTGWQDSQAKLTMILKNRHGDEHSRKLKMKIMEVLGDGDKSLSIFNSPRDIKGTAFLSFTHALDPDEQWLYLPAIKRVKRISSRNKSGPYLGSEFAFEDLSSFEVAKYDYKYIKDEIYDGIESFVIEAYPQYEHSGYTKLVLWIDKNRYILVKTDYYDRKNSLLKTQTFHGYKQYLDQYWRPDEMRMVNHINGKSTILLWQEYQFKKGLTKRSFDKNALKRAR